MNTEVNKLLKCVYHVNISIQSFDLNKLTFDLVDVNYCRTYEDDAHFSNVIHMKMPCICAINPV